MASRNSRTHGTHSQPKQPTCNICRERKVRCDRERPQCQRCRKSGHECIYPSENTASHEIKSALQFLHNRLLQAETKLEEHGLQPGMKSREDELHVQSTSPEDFMQTEPPAPLSEKLGTFQTTYDLGLQGEEMDFSDINFSEFSEFDHSDYHQLPTLVGSVTGSGPDKVHSAIDLGMTDPRGSIPDVDSTIPPDHGSYMWPSTPVIPQENQSDSSTKHRFEPTAPLMNIERQCQPYFNIVQKHLMLVDQQEFFSFLVFGETHQCKALKFAVAMSGSHACGDSVLATECYSMARYHMGKALGLIDGSSFMNIETIQASLLIARYELTHYSGLKGLLTLAGLMQLIRLLGYDRLDQNSLEDERHDSNISKPQRETSGNLQKIRQTFWLAFSLHCNAAAIFPTCMPVEDQSICTALPTSNLKNESAAHQAVHSSGNIAGSGEQESSVFALFILAMKLLVRGERHRQRTTRYVLDSKSDYNFCFVHGKIGEEIMVIFNALSRAELLDEPNTELRVLALVIILGIRMDWFKTAVIAVQKASFLASAGNEYRDSCLAIANTLCDLLIQAEIIDENQKPGSRIAVYKEMSFFILRPLALAAEVHIDALKNSQDTVSGVCLTSREIRQNLQTICSVMSMCRPVTEEYNVKIQACLAFLDMTKHKSVLRTGFLGKSTGMNR